MEEADQLPSISRNLLGGRITTEQEKLFGLRFIMERSRGSDRYVIPQNSVHFVFLTIFVWGKLLPCLLVSVRHQYNERLAAAVHFLSCYLFGFAVPGKKGREVIIPTTCHTSRNIAPMYNVIKFLTAHSK